MARGWPPTHPLDSSSYSIDHSTRVLHAVGLSSREELRHQYLRVFYEISTALEGHVNIFKSTKTISFMDLVHLL